MKGWVHDEGGFNREILSGTWASSINVDWHFSTLGLGCWVSPVSMPDRNGICHMYASS